MEVLSYLPHVVFATCFLGLISLYVIYYLVFVVARPKVVCSDSRRARALRHHCPALFERYWPTFWTPQGHMQSILRILTQIKPRLEKGRRERLCMSDGGHICLDWFNERGTPPGFGARGSEDPIVLILPGITGSSEESYVQHWIDDITRLGYRSVVFNYRGCGGTKLSTPRMYSVGDVSDLTEVVDHIHSNNPSSPIVGVGISMGSIQFIRYVAECKRQRRPPHVTAVLAFSVVWNLKKADKALHNQFFNKYVVSRFLAVRYTSILKENQSIFQELEDKGDLCFDLQTVLKAKTIRDVNSSCIVQMFNYTDDPLQHSYSPCENAGDLTVPVIAVTSADDPFCPIHAIPVEIAHANHNLVLVTTRTGGHIGFLQGLLPFWKNYMDTLLVQFLTAVLKHNIFSEDAYSDDVSESDLDIAHSLL